MDLEPQFDERQHETPTLTRDTIFSVLSNERRRQTLQYLRTSPESDIAELSRHLAAWENDVAPDDITYKQRKRVYTSLRQSHLPKLADAGVIDYDPDRGTVSLTTRAGPFESHLDAERDAAGRVAWPTVYLGIAAVGVVLTVLVSRQLLPATLSGTVVAGGLAAVLAAVAGVHAYLDSDDAGHVDYPLR